MVYIMNVLFSVGCLAIFAIGAMGCLGDSRSESVDIAKFDPNMAVYSALNLSNEGDI